MLYQLPQTQHLTTVTLALYIFSKGIRKKYDVVLDL